ncbi:MAG: hypothetical protein CM1200mP2_53600 [Planctomycetaceae bacterium]|nr:MAG: hypothetical protein CM1200mP2_53600 [Planctomycetaceae bacterium]
MIRPRFVHASAWLILTSLVVGCPSGGPQDSPASDPSGVTGAAEDIGENSSEQDRAAQTNANSRLSIRFGRLEDDGQDWMELWFPSI